MRIYLLSDPKRYTEFAGFGQRGTWSPGKLCEACGRGTQRLVEPLLVEWEAGSTNVGDFSWCSYTFAVVAGVRAFLRKEEYGCRFGAVEVVKPKLKTRGWARIPYPYDGPPLIWVIPKYKLHLNIQKTGLLLRHPDCDTCGQRSAGFTREGIVVDADQWSGHKMFRIEEFGKSAATFITEEALQELLDGGFSNIGHLESGVIEEARPRRTGAAGRKPKKRSGR